MAGGILGAVAFLIVIVLVLRGARREAEAALQEALYSDDDLKTDRRPDNIQQLEGYELSDGTYERVTGSGSSQTVNRCQWIQLRQLDSEGRTFHYSGVTDRELRRALEWLAPQWVEVAQRSMLGEYTTSLLPVELTIRQLVTAAQILTHDAEDAWAWIEERALAPGPDGYWPALTLLRYGVDRPRRRELAQQPLASTYVEVAGRAAVLLDDLDGLLQAAVDFNVPTDVRRAAVRDLKALEEHRPEIVARLMRAVEVRKSFDQEQALIALVELEATDQVPQMIALLEKRTARASFLIDALTALGGREAVGPLMRVMEDHSLDGTTREKAEEAIAVIQARLAENGPLGGGLAVVDVAEEGALSTVAAEEGGLSVARED